MRLLISGMFWVVISVNTFEGELAPKRVNRTGSRDGKLFDVVNVMPVMVSFFVLMTSPTSIVLC